MHPLRIFVNFVVVADASAAAARSATVFVAAVPIGGTIVIERPEVIEVPVASGTGGNGLVVAAVPNGGTSVIERPVLSERGEIGFAGAVVQTKDFKREDKTITEPPTGTTTIYVTDSPIPHPVEHIASITKTHTVTANPPYDVVLIDGSVEEAIVTTTAIVQATVVTTVTVVGYSGGSSFTIMSGLQPTICKSTTDTNCIPGSAITTLVTTTTAQLTSSANAASVLSSDLSVFSAMKSTTPAVVTVTSTSTEHLPGASSTVHLGSNSASEGKGGNDGLNMSVAMILSFLLALML